MTTTPNEPVQDPDVVPSGDPGVEPGKPPGIPGEGQPRPADPQSDPETESGL